MLSFVQEGLWRAYRLQFTTITHQVIFLVLRGTKVDIGITVKLSDSELLAILLALLESSEFLSQYLVFFIEHLSLVLEVSDFLHELLHFLPLFEGSDLGILLLKIKFLLCLSDQSFEFINLLILR